PSNEERGWPRPKLHAFRVGSAECTREINRSWRASAFRQACCFPSWFFPTLLGNRSPPALREASPRKNCPGKRDRGSNDGTAHHRHMPFASIPPRNRSNF